MLSVADVARRLGISRTRVIQLDDRLKPARAIDGARVYTTEALDAFEAERRTRADAKGTP